MMDVDAPERLKLPADGKAILLGQHDVEQERSNGRFPRATKRVLAVPNDLDLVAFEGQVALEAQRDARLIFDTRMRVMCCSLAGRPDFRDRDMRLCPRLQAAPS